jgi:hypothetical protein
MIERHYNYGTFIDGRGEFARQLLFLSNAVSDDENRPFMQYILVEPSDKEEGLFKGVATDGRRLHVVDPLALPGGFGLEPGNWKVLKASTKSSWIAKILSPIDAKNSNTSFPNYRRVIPQGEPVFKTSFIGCALTGNRKFNHLSDMIKFIRDFPEPTVFNLDFLMDLGSTLVWDVGWYSGHNAASFISGDYMAVIMPMQYDVDGSV